MFLEAVEAAAASIPELFVVMVGRGPEWERIRSLAASSALAGRIRFAGKTTAIRDHLATMDLACLTSKSNEGLSNAILEKMAMGLPVIATAVGGNPELVRDGETGCLVRAGDAGSLAEAMTGLYRNRELCRRLGQNGRRRIEDRFTLERMVRQHEQLYERLAGRSSVAAAASRESRG
jgi:glycosyltransferase involved in cell wall biosynthesis